MKRALFIFSLVFFCSSSGVWAQVSTTSQSNPSLNFEMVFVRGGYFTMGATIEQGAGDFNDLPQQTVEVRDFFIGKYEVTQAQWKAVMGWEPQGEWAWTEELGRGDNYPAYNVSRDEVQQFIRKLNEMTGRKYRLPSEPEWEYAARGGERNVYHKYSGSDTLGNVAWYAKNSNGKIHPVGQKQPNELGIYDMSGNVWEWIIDFFNPNTYSDLYLYEDNYTVKSSICPYRGGSWYSDSHDCRVSQRLSNNLGTHSTLGGFRLVLIP